MLRHINITEYGTYIKVSGETLIVEEKNKKVAVFPLNRIKSISISKKGMSLSSNVFLVCANRGIKIFFLDFTNRVVAALYGTSQHAVAKIRQKNWLMGSMNEILPAKDG